ncbi:hypothetical protein V3C99_009960 [Haemonchus contortus]
MDLLIIFVTTYICSIVLVTNSFVYRYLCLCRAQFFQEYSTKTSILVGFFLNLLVILNYFIIAYFAFWPSQDFERLIWNCVEVAGINLNGAVFLGVSMKYNMSGFQLALIIDIFFFMASMVFINIFCAVKIHCYLKSGARSSNSLSLQRRLFVLLQLQTCSPFIFLYIPSFFALFLVFADVDTTLFITDITCTLINLYPIINSIVIIAFIPEYREFVVSKLKLK